MLADEPFSLSDLLDEQVRTFAGQSQKHALSLSPGPEPVIIAQVVANLLSNAIKYSPDGGAVNVTASRTAPSSSPWPTTAWASQRPGRRTSSRSSSASSVRQRSGWAGSGLGLALAHEIVVAHGGRMGFESAEGEGSRF